METEGLAKLFIQLSVFGLIIAVWLAAITIWVLRRSRRQKALERRLQFAEQGAEELRTIRLWHDGQAVDTAVPDSLHMSFAERLERMREDAGWQSPMLRILIVLFLFMIIIGLLVWVITGKMLIVVGAGITMGMLFRTHLLRRIAKRTGLFEKQLIEALDLGARSLRAGHPLSGAFKLISQEVGAPVNTIFSEIIEQEALGVSLQKALYGVSQKSRNPDMKIFATSVVIQLRSGGNLADMIDRVAWVVRERMRLHRRARVLTAEAQLSKWVLLALPIGMFVALNLLNPTYMEPFFQGGMGTLLLVVAIVMLMIGAWTMNQMARLKY
jgi:tight adherence protein B